MIALMIGNLQMIFHLGLRRNLLNVAVAKDVVNNPFLWELHMGSVSIKRFWLYNGCDSQIIHYLFGLRLQNCYERTGSLKVGC